MPVPVVPGASPSANGIDAELAGYLYAALEPAPMSIEELVLGDSRLVFLGSDLGAGLFARLRAEAPDRFLMGGIQEQHLNRYRRRAGAGRLRTARDDDRDLPHPALPGTDRGRRGAAPASR